MPKFVYAERPRGHKGAIAARRQEEILTFPEVSERKKAGGTGGEGTDETLINIKEILSEQEATHRRLGHLATES